MYVPSVIAVADRCFSNLRNTPFYITLDKLVGQAENPSIFTPVFWGRGRGGQTFSLLCPQVLLGNLSL